MDNLNNLYAPVRDRIFALLKSRSIQQKDFADAIGISTATITDWKKGRTSSFMKKLTAIAEALDTSENWLLTGEGGAKESLQMDKELFVQNVKKYCALRGVKPTVACRESGVSSSFISNIEGRNQTPSVEKVQMLANYLGVTTSELLGEEKPSPNNEEKATIDVIDDDLREYLDELRTRPETRLLFSVTKNATKSQIEAIVKMVEEMQGKK